MWLCCQHRTVTKKHKNTKSEPKSDQLANQKEIDAIKTECIFNGIEDIEDMFQLE